MRRAWIEIGVYGSVQPLETVSLSMRRAWIEIGVYGSVQPLETVALHAESVDRNRMKLPKLHD